MLGAGAAAGACSAAACATRRRRSRLDVTPGTVQPMPIAMPDFVGGSPRTPRLGAQRHRRHHQQPAAAADCSRRSIRRPIIEKIANIDAVPRFQDWRAINAQALVTGRVDAPGRRPPQGRIPAVGRVRRPAAHRPAIFHAAGQLAAHRAHHLRRDLRAPDRREGLLRHAAWCSSTKPARRTRRVKRLAIMDQDGANVRYLTRGDDLVLTPRFSPSTPGNHLHVVSARRDPRCFCSTSRPASARWSAISPA